MNVLKFRDDIQAIRGVAVLAVVGYHAGLLPGGYLGVDMFFTLSGYLLARLVTAGGAIAAVDFYCRRAIRLVPTMLAALVLTAAVARLLLTQAEMESFRHQVLGATFFVSNVVLWSQGGYFDLDAASKPLLHTWSLGVEAQVILVAPLLGLVSTGRRLPILVLVSIASLCLCAALAWHDSDAAFFLAPARVWEFGIGAIVALSGCRLSTGTRPVSIALVVVLTAFPPAWQHPGIGATLICAATAAFLSSPGGAVHPIARPVAWLGDISYPLYLVHWPMIALATSVYLGAPPPAVVALLIVGSVPLAWLLHIGIERPARRFAYPVRLWAGAICAVVLALAPALGRAAEIDWAEERRPNHGIGQECEYDGEFEPRLSCVIGPSPRVLVWGDSIAMQWAAGLLETRGDDDPGIAQATMSTCGPLLGVAPLYTGRLGRAWAQRCLTFNDQVMAWLRSEQSISTVVLSARLLSYVEPGQRLLTRNGTARQSVLAGRRALQATIDAIRAAGKGVVVLGPIPEASFDVGACLERRHRGLPIAGRDDCSISEREHRRINGPALQLLDLIAADGTTVVRVESILCHAGRCAGEIDGVPIYRDRAHLSRRGSAVAARHMMLWDRRIISARSGNTRSHRPPAQPSHLGQ